MQQLSKTTCFRAGQDRCGPAAARVSALCAERTTRNGFLTRRKRCDSVATVPGFP
jgi:hypothetical protein